MVIMCSLYSIQIQNLCSGHENWPVCSMFSDYLLSPSVKATKNHLYWFPRIVLALGYCYCKCCECYWFGLWILTATEYNICVTSLVISVCMVCVYYKLFILTAQYSIDDKNINWQLQDSYTQINTTITSLWWLEPPAFFDCMVFVPLPVWFQFRWVCYSLATPKIDQIVRLWGKSYTCGGCNIQHISNSLFLPSSFRGQKRLCANLWSLSIMFELC